MPTTKKTTLRDIALKLNITVATVSRALSNHPDISQKIKDQVKLVAEALHYRPNSFALHLRHQRSGTIGVILPKIVHYYSSTMISGILNAAHKAGYQVLLCDSGQTLEEESSNLDALINTGVDGILVSMSNHSGNEELYVKLTEAGLPTVFFDKVPSTFSACKVSTNDYTGAFMATEHLLQQGYKNIAHIKGQIGSKNTQPRWQGYIAALEKYNQKPFLNLIRECTFCTEKEGYEITLSLMKETIKPDALFCVNDETAIGALAALRKLRIAVPQKVGVVGFSNAIAGSFSWPTLTTVDQFGEVIGSKSAETLLDLIMNPDKNKPEFYQQIITEPQLICRDSSQRNKK